MSRPFILVTFLCIPIIIHGYEYRPNKDTLTTHASLNRDNVYETAHSTSQWDVNSQSTDSDISDYQEEDDVLTYSDLWKQLTKEATKSLDILSHLYQSWLQEEPSRHKEGSNSQIQQQQLPKNVNLMDALRNMVYQGLMQIQSVGKGTRMLSHAVNDQVQNLRRRVVSHRAQETPGGGGGDHVDILKTKDSLDRAMKAWVRGVYRRVDMLKYSLYETLLHAGRQIQDVGEGTQKLSHAVHDGIRHLRRTAVPQNRREDTSQQNSNLNKALTAWLGGISNSMDYLGNAIYRGLLKIQKVGEHTHNLSHSVAHSISNSRGRAQLRRTNVRQRHHGRRQG